MNCFYDIQGNFSCKPKKNINNVRIENFSNDVEMQPKHACKPKDCLECPTGTYCQTCNECSLRSFNYGNQELKMLVCDCPNIKKEKKRTTLSVNSEYCDLMKHADITNCDGHLTCGKCSLMK